MTNSLLQHLHAYPFARLRTLMEGVQANPARQEIQLTIGEPQASPPEFVLDEIKRQLHAINRYPLVIGQPDLRDAISSWASRRYDLGKGFIDAQTQVLPLQGTREGLFAIAQVVVDAAQHKKPLVMMPSPFYQIYEGAALLAGAEPHYLPCSGSDHFAMDISRVTEEEWQRCQLLYICSPSNPTAYVATAEDYIQLLQLADKYDFVIVSDECYSEIYLDEASPPVGLLEVCEQQGRDDLARCLVFNSLSKRSNLAGMRSGFVAGDANLIKAFLQYRTYHGSAMPLHHQQASIAAWNDEEHVVANRAMYRKTIRAFVAELERSAWGDKVSVPSAGFCLWMPTPIDDREFVRRLYQKESVLVLPGSFLARDQAGQINPGKNYVRIALVHSEELCTEAAGRLTRFLGRVVG